MQSANTTDGTTPAPPEERDLELAAAFRPNELVWLVEERYVPINTSWLVDVVRRGPQGNWMRQRYHYDVPTSVIFFLGERPVSDDELSSLRHSGKVFPVSELQKARQQA